MDKKEEFKEFAKAHPELNSYITTHPDMTWQKFYEIYDIYGDSERSWSPYLTKNTSDLTSIKNFSDIVKNIDINSIQEHIKTAQKALGFIQELTTKGAEKVTTLYGPTSPRPINKFFGD